MSKILNFFRNRTFLCWFGMTLGTLLYCMTIVFVIDEGEFYTGGVTGICQILANAVFKMPILKSILVALFNVPLFLVGFKKVSKRFAILSLASVALQTLSLYVFQLIYNSGFHPFKEMFVEMTASDRVILALLGGIATGVGCGLSLKYGASTGGMDIISQAFSFKTNKSFGSVSFSIDIFVVLLAMVVSEGTFIDKFQIGLYTVIRLATSSITLDKIHKTYNFQKITIITQHVDEVKEAMLKVFHHGISISEGIGGYSGQKNYKLECVCLSYEVEDFRRLISKVAPNAFVYYTPVKGIQGKFNKKAIS